MTCSYHATAAASAACVNCGTPICGSCTHIIKSNSICPTCAPEIRSRLQNDPNAVISAGSTATAYTQSPSAGVSPAGSGTPYPAASTTAAGYAGAEYAGITADGSTAALAKARAEDRMNLLKGIGAGLAIGIIGSIITLKILFYAHFGLSYLYIGVGYGIGAGVWHFTNRGGTQLAIASLGIFVLSLAIAHLVYANDLLMLARASGDADPGMTVIDVFPLAIQSFSFMHWVCIFIGLAACWNAADRQPA